MLQSYEALPIELRATAMKAVEVDMDLLEILCVDPVSFDRLYTSVVDQEQRLNARFQQLMGAVPDHLVGPVLIFMREYGEVVALRRLHRAKIGARHQRLMKAARLKAEEARKRGQAARRLN